VKEVAKAVGENLDSYKVIVTKSTVPAGTGTIIREIVEKYRPEAHAFSVVSNPEFLREGSAIEDFLRPNRVVLGTEDEQAAAILKDLYRPLYLIETPFVTTNVVTAELIKYASNAFLATKISFINEMADLCEALEPTSTMWPGAWGSTSGSGGSSPSGPRVRRILLPKDTRAVMWLAEEKGLRLRVIGGAVP